MKTFQPAIAGLCAFAALSATAAPFLTIGDNAEVFLTGTAGIDFNDNVTLTSEAVDDTVFIFTPGVAFEFGNNSLTTGSLTYQEEITRYSDNDGFDAELSNVAFNSRYNNGKTSFSVYASWVQLNQNTVDTRVPNAQVLSRRDATVLGVGGEWGVSEKSSVSIGADYRDTNYKRAGFADLERFEVPVRYYYEMTPKVDLTLGATYRENTLAGALNDSEDHLFSVGARGDFTPKLTGQILVGYTERDLESGSDRGTLGLDARLTYFLSEKTTVDFGIGNDFGNSGTGESQENFDLSLGMRSQVAADFAVVARAMHRRIDYFVRPDDDYTEAHVGVEYTVNRYVSLGGGYTYRNNESELSEGDFDNSVFSLSARLRY